MVPVCVSKSEFESAVPSAREMAGCKRQVAAAFTFAIFVGGATLYLNMGFTDFVWQAAGMPSSIRPTVQQSYDNLARWSGEAEERVMATTGYCNITLIRSLRDKKSHPQWP